MTITTEQQQTIYQVSQLNQSARTLLETHFKTVWVEGEISNLSRPASGHWYFSLKDADCQVRCAMFRMHNSRVSFVAEDGLQVLLRAKVSLYTARGDFQLIVEHIEESGDGKLQRAFEALKRKLDAEGLFASEHKQALPKLPRSVGIITSATGAAVRDIISTLARRFPAIHVVLYPCEVQGKTAATQIAKAIQAANQRADCDVLIVARGGGSLEDLWPFNEEIVARAIFASALPIVSGVGHEVDFTIADFVADVRAATPTAAAETASPDKTVWISQFQQIAQHLQQATQRHYTHLLKEVTHLRKRLRHPRQQLQEKQQTLDYLQQQLQQHLQLIRTHKQHQLAQLQTRLQQQHPQQHYTRLYDKLQDLQRRLCTTTPQLLQQHAQKLAQLQRTLTAVGPQATLQRGYAIVTDQQQNIIRSDQETQPGQPLQVRLHEGEIKCTVD